MRRYTCPKCTSNMRVVKDKIKDAVMLVCWCGYDIQQQFYQQPPQYILPLKQ